jgi:multiple sugar transport system substrate-binding protein
MSRPLAIVLAIGVCLVVVGLLVKPGPSDAADVVDADWASAAPHGTIRYCTGNDLSGVHNKSAGDFNESFPEASVSVDEASFITDASRKEYLQSIENGTNECDVIFLDVIYMKEFASRDLLYDMTPYLTHARRAAFNDVMVRTTEHHGKRWGVPKQLDVGVLYYRGDHVPAPRSWQDVYRAARRNGDTPPPGLRLPIGSYEGLTVVFLELAYAAGAEQIVSEDGRRASIDQPQVLKALRFMRNARRDRVTPDLDLQTDLSNLDVYERGRADFLRGWPFVAQSLHRDVVKARTPRLRIIRRTTAAQTDIVPLPPWREGGRSVGILGGHNLVIPRSAQNPSAALRFIAYLTSDAQVRKDEQRASQYPVLKHVARDFDLHNPSLIDAVQQTEIVTRPPIVKYAAVSKIIADGVKAAIEHPRDDAFTRRTLQRIQRDVQHVLDGS